MSTFLITFSCITSDWIVIAMNDLVALLVNVVPDCFSHHKAAAG